MLAERLKTRQIDTWPPFAPLSSGGDRCRTWRTGGGPALKGRNRRHSRVQFSHPFTLRYVMRSYAALPTIEWRLLARASTRA